LAVPGEGLEDVRQEQKSDRWHGAA
jgi:hypothetical protein